MEIQTKKLILQISCKNDYAEFDYGVIEMTQAAADRIRKMSEVVKTAKEDIFSYITEIRAHDHAVTTMKLDYDAEELDGDKLPLVEPEYGRIECCKLNVSGIGFYWSFYPKHCDDICTTSRVLISELDSFDTIDEREVQK